MVHTSNSSTWQQQWERANRFYTRISNVSLEELVVAKIAQGQDYSKMLKEEEIRYEDDLISFFQHCWHIKDWIKKDPSVSDKTKDTIEKDLNSYSNIKIAQDLCNRTKHLVLDGGTSSFGGETGSTIKGRQLEIVAAASLRDKGQAPSEPTQWHYMIEYDQEMEEGGVTRETDRAIDIARNALNEWKAYLRKEALL